MNTTLPDAEEQSTPRRRRSREELMRPMIRAVYEDLEGYKLKSIALPLLQEGKAVCANEWLVPTLLTTVEQFLTRDVLVIVSLRQDQGLSCTTDDVLQSLLQTYPDMDGDAMSTVAVNWLVLMQRNQLIAGPVDADDGFDWKGNWRRFEPMRCTQAVAGFAIYCELIATGVETLHPDPEAHPILRYLAPDDWVVRPEDFPYLLRKISRNGWGYVLKSLI